MNRRSFLHSAAVLAAGAVASPPGVAAIPKMKIRRIRFHEPPEAESDV